jgi:hypothetical protein
MSITHSEAFKVFSKDVKDNQSGFVVNTTPTYTVARESALASS